MEQALFIATNRIRFENDVRDLVYDEGLAVAARYHAKEMAELQYFSHTSPNPETQTSSDRVALAGIATLSVGENNHRTSEKDFDQIVSGTIAGWMDSSGHRKTLLHPRITHVGFGVATDSRGNTYVVQVVARRILIVKSGTVVERLLNRYEVKLSFDLADKAVVKINYGLDHSPIKEFEAGRNRISFITGETCKIHLRASIDSPNHTCFIGQDSGWFTLATSNFERDPSAHTSELKFRTVASQIKRVKYYVVDIIIDNPLDKEITLIIDDDIVHDFDYERGHLRFQIEVGEKPEIFIGYINGDKIKFDSELTIAKIGGRPRLIPIVGD